MGNQGFLLFIFCGFVRWALPGCFPHQFVKDTDKGEQR